MKNGLNSVKVPPDSFPPELSGAVAQMTSLDSQGKLRKALIICLSMSPPIKHHIETYRLRSRPLQIRQKIGDQPDERQIGADVINIIDARLVGDKSQKGRS